MQICRLYQMCVVPAAIVRSVHGPRSCSCRYQIAVKAYIHSHTVLYIYIYRFCVAPETTSVNDVHSQAIVAEAEVSFGTVY
jgi:hypothetical protein